MAFVRKPDSGGGDTLKFNSVGDSVTGVYLGSQDYLNGKFGPAIKHIFKTEKGLKVAFFKPGSQPDSLLTGEIGKRVCLTFSSTKNTGKGNPMKLFTLDVDDSYVPTEDELEMTVDEDNDDDTEMDEVTTAPAKNSPRATPPTAKKRAAVNAFVNARSK